jgi:hypothetical protein
MPLPYKLILIGHLLTLTLLLHSGMDVVERFCKSRPKILYTILSAMIYTTSHLCNNIFITLITNNEQTRDMERGHLLEKDQIRA